MSKRWFLYFFVFSFSFFCHANQTLPQDFEAVAKKSSLNFISYTKMFGISSEVPGLFKNFSVLVSKNHDLDKSQVKLSIEANSIDTKNEKRDKHLNEEDFFYTKKYPNISFQSTSIKEIDKKGNYKIFGLITLKDKTIPLVMDVLAKNEDGFWKVSGSKKFSRKALGLNYKAPFFLPSLEDEIIINFDIVLEEKAQAKDSGKNLKSKTLKAKTDK